MDWGEIDLCYNLLKMKSAGLVSVVVPVYNEAEGIRDLK